MVALTGVASALPKMRRLRMCMALALRIVAGAAILCAHIEAAFGWVYPEHRDISLEAVNGLDPAARAELSELWDKARIGHTTRLCALPAETSQGTHPACLDWAALAAIAGDHSCSSAELADTALRSTWILSVADVGARLRSDLQSIDTAAARAGAGTAGTATESIRRRLQSAELRARRINALRTADLHLQRADTEYATRAGSNNAHFLMPRPGVGTDQTHYVADATRAGTELNAIGVYAMLHRSALANAARLAAPDTPASERDALAFAALFDEAFALHFLQDTFSAGHIAGSWGNASQRKGTHDYYNQNGLEVGTWGDRNHSVLLMGDANMRPEDESVAAQAVRASLIQLLAAASGKLPQLGEAARSAPYGPNAFNVCKAQVFPSEAQSAQVASTTSSDVSAVVALSPVPGLGEGLGSIARFRSEFGGFVGLAGSIDTRVIDGGFAPMEDQRGHVEGLDLSVRVGLGMAGVLDDSGDGRVYVSAGLRADTASSNTFADVGKSGAGGVMAAIPARTGLSLRVRMPFFLIPGDLLLMSPLLLIKPEAYERMAVTAVNGGFIPWQSGMATRFGRFQFILGRELGVTLYGRGSQADQLFVEGPPPDYPVSIVKYRSMLFDIPVLEYRAYRSFSGNQSSSVTFQFFADADVPSDAHDVNTGASVSLHTVWSVGLRLHAEWRYYP